MPARFKWSLVSDERLLDTRICDLPIRIKGSFIEPHIKRLYSELNVRGIRFKPHVWLSAEWFTPDGVPGFAIPFYLAHPRLMKLERKYMREVEGGTDVECMRILRHEAGHALDNAFRLHFKRRWIRTFGSFAQKYPPSYKPKPNSRRYVLNLDAWYAQAHPAEDFAETFAVWLQPRSNWRRRYRGWPALRKLEFVDRLMGELAGKPPAVTKGHKTYDVRRLRSRLRTHYDRRRRLYAEESPGFFDSDLKHIFVDRSAASNGTGASRFLRRWRKPIVDSVVFWTRERKFTVDRLLKQLITRCDELKLCVPRDEDRAKVETAAYLSALVSNYLFTGRLKRGP